MVVDKVLKDDSDMFEKIPIVVDNEERPMSPIEKLEPALVEREERARRTVNDS